MKCTRRNFLLGLGVLPAVVNVKADVLVSLPMQKKVQSSTSVDLSRLLDSIAQVETGNRDDVIGSKGERSRYQISEAVWRQHNGFLVKSQVSDHHFRTYCRQEEARLCAVKHLGWLDNNLPASTPLEKKNHLSWVVYGYRSGLSSARYQQQFWHWPSFSSYTKRVMNLYLNA